MPAFASTQAAFQYGHGAAGGLAATYHDHSLPPGDVGSPAWQQAPQQQQQPLREGSAGGRLQGAPAHFENRGLERPAITAQHPAAVSPPASQQGSQRSHDGQQWPRTYSNDHPDTNAAQPASGSVPASLRSSVHNEEALQADWHMQGQHSGSRLPDMHLRDGLPSEQRAESNRWQPAADHSPMQAPAHRMSMAALPQEDHQALPGAPGGEQLHQGQPGSAQHDRRRATQMPSAPLYVDQRRMTNPYAFHAPHQDAQSAPAPAAQVERRATTLPSAHAIQHRMSTLVPTQEVQAAGMSPAQVGRGSVIGPEMTNTPDQRRMTSPPSLLQLRQSFAFGEPLGSIPEQPGYGAQASAHQSVLAAATLERRSTSAPDLVKEPSFGFSRAPVVQQQQQATPAPSVPGSRRPSFVTADLMRPLQRSDTAEPLQPATPRMPQVAHSVPEQATSGQVTPASGRRVQASGVQWQQPPAPHEVKSRQGSLLNRQPWAEDLPGGRGSITQIITGARSLTESAILASVARGQPSQASGTGQALQAGAYDAGAPSRRASAAPGRQQDAPAEQTWQAPDQASDARHAQGAMLEAGAAAQPDSEATGYPGSADAPQLWQGQVGSEAAARRASAAADSQGMSQPWAADASAPDQAQGFTVYDNELAAGAEAAQKVMRLAAGQPLQEPDDRVRALSCMHWPTPVCQRTCPLALYLQVLTQRVGHRSVEGVQAQGYGCAFLGSHVI